ncbi:MAG: WYL domain-containing protein [Bacteroidales bacterium]|nr:WYL domain-containing protein [Bacteroidales bacterium]
MRNIDTFRQYIWLINTVLQSKKISLERIQKLWINNDLNNGKPLSRTTFYRLRQAIEDMFGIIITCDNNDGYQYLISNPETLKDHSTQIWMLQTLTVNNILIDSLSIKDRLVLEEIPEGMEYLPTIINAIKNNIMLKMTHQGFDSPTPKTIAIEPYCLKVFRQRWYLLVKSDQHPNELRIYALDRIIKLKETNQTFEMDPSFNANNFFKYFFGVFIDDKEKPIRIVLRAYGKMIPLLRTLPKHHTQREINTTEQYTDYEYLMAPTFDFKQEILKEGPDLEVLEPQSLREEIRTSLANSLSRYQTY